MPTRRQGNFVLACVAGAAVAYAFYAQFGLDLVPCHLCIFQRVTLAAMAAVFLLATTFVLVNLFVDVLYTYLDPRIRLR